MFALAVSDDRISMQSRRHNIIAELRTIPGTLKTYYISN
jgi:hypothetical protein